jgi:hypothetical protein
MHTKVREDHELGNLLIKKGTPLEVEFLIKFPRAIRVSFSIEGRKIVRMTSMREAHTWISRFTQPPQTEKIKRWLTKKEARTVTGKKVSLYGTGDDGSPSWLSVLRKEQRQWKNLHILRNRDITGTKTIVLNTRYL